MRKNSKRTNKEEYAMFEEEFMKLVQQYQGFEIVHAYRDDVDHYLGGKTIITGM